MGARIGIIGAGQVGAAAGYLLSAMPGISDIVLVDTNPARAAGEAADIAHAAAFGTSARVVEGSYADLAGAAVVVITAGASLQPGQTRLQLLHQHCRRVSGLNLPMLMRVMNYPHLALDELTRIAADAPTYGAIVDNA